MVVAADRYTAAGDEVGTAPGDRSFRPDVQGLRAVAILLVLLFHAAVPGITGGFVGVDVFFVISGFVITGVLLRERQATRSTSVLHFYGRRARRIIPAASLVIVVTVAAAALYLGSLTGHETAVDGQWAALFLANFHFAASQTNYLASQRPPSALQNYWSLAVEEQFYIVYPTVFLVTARLATRISLRVRLASVLVSVIAASFLYSVVLTPANPSVAFFSPLTRAWELALGGLIAVAGDSLRRLPQPVAALMGWLGLGAILMASLTLSSASVYPGALVAVPVLGAGLVIAGGTAQPVWGVEQLLGQRPFQLLGLISYSLYLWHWPILVIAAQRRGVVSLPVWDNVVLLMVATLAATVTYLVIENPVRHSMRLKRRRWNSVIAGGCLVVLSFAVATVVQQRPVVDLGSLAAAAPGSRCHEPTPSMVSHLRSEFASSQGARGQTPVEQRSVVVIGDSTACTLLPGLEAVGPSYGLHFEDGTVIGCGVVSGPVPSSVYISQTLNESCQGRANRAEATAIERYQPSIVVWISTQERNSIVVHTASGDQTLTSGSPQWDTVMLRRMNTRVERLTATGADVVLVQEPPSVHLGNQLNANDQAYGWMNGLLSQVAARHPTDVGLVDLGARVCPSGPPCPFVVDGFGSTVATATQAIRPDAEHYLPEGSLWVARWLVPEIVKATARRS